MFSLNHTHQPVKTLAEFHVHGSISIIKKIELELDKIEYVREAEPGEFTKRSLQNDKIDLLQAEGLDDLLKLLPRLKENKRN